MANNFVIRKGLVVSGSDLQPLDIQGTTGQRFTAASSSQGNTLSINNISGTPLLRVSASNFTIGKQISSTNWAVVSALNSIVVTGSAFLTSTAISGSLPQGNLVLAEGEYSHAQGHRTTASRDYSHAEGSGSHAEGNYSHAEGWRTLASGNYSHAEGRSTTASGDYSHAEGSGSIASGSYSHAEGRRTLAVGDYSHAEGTGSYAQGNYQHVQGQFNVTSSIQSAFIHGNGTSNTARRNLIHTYGTGDAGVVEISGSVILNAGSEGGTIREPLTTIQATSYTLTPSDTGTVLLFRDSIPGDPSSNCIVNFPTTLPLGFSTTLITVDQTLHIETGSGITFINNVGNGLGMKSSTTLIYTGTPNQYLSIGDL